MAREPENPPEAETPVATYLQRHPAAARIFLEHRMACVGCSLASFDTLGDAAREYRLPLPGFLAELGRASARPRPNRPIDRSRP